MAEAEIIAIEKETDKVGRPCKYESHVEPRLNEILEWLKQGYTDYSIADSLGIHQNTWMRYRDNYSILNDLYIRARTHRNRLVMNAQFEKAKGIKEVIKKPIKLKRVKYVDGKRFSEEETIEYADEMLYVPPDTNAADLFLRNNDPDYKQAKQADSGQNITVNFQLPQLEQDLAQIAEKRKSLEALLHRDYEVIE